MVSVGKLIIAIFLFVISMIVGFGINLNKRTVSKDKTYKLFNFFKKLEKYDNLTELHNKLIKKISLFTSSYEVSSNYAYFFIIIYIATAILGTIIVSFLDEIWYIKLINVGLILLLPYAIINAFINTKYNFVKKQIPIAIEEFQYWFFRKKKISDALRETSQHLKGNIAKPFQMCYYNTSQGEIQAIKILKSTFDDVYMDKFCQLLMTYIEHGGEPEVLNSSLTELSTQINLDISFTQKQKDRFTKFKVGAVILIIFTIIIEKYLGLMLTDDSMIINASKNNTAYISLIIYFIIYFFFINLLERF